MPHGRASTKQIQSGELVTIDFGAVLNGYHSDETVTIGVGKLDQRQQQIYALVLEAHDRAIAAVRPGISCKELDAVARNYICDQGFGDFLVTVWDTASDWRFTNSLPCRRAARLCWTKGWWSPSSPVSTSPAGAGCGSRTR